MSPPDEYRPSGPYKGLMPYTEDDAHYFFGRTTEQEIIAANLRAARLTLLYGPSGVGKSSVLHAGVAYYLHQLAQQNLAEYGTPEFVVVIFNDWRDDPISGLVAQIQTAIGQTFARSTETTVLSSNLPLESTLTQTLETWTSQLGIDLLIILDQFEEYFLYQSQSGGPDAFSAEFCGAINRPGLRVNFLISIREDALAKLDLFKGRIPNLFDNYLRLEHLDREDARAAIERPIEQYNRITVDKGDDAVNIEPTLVEAVLDQVQTGQVRLSAAGLGVVESRLTLSPETTRIETPYLQLVMSRLWSEEMRAGSRTLRQATLVRLGGASPIVRTHLDATLSAMPDDKQEIAARIFHHLVTPSGTKIAHTAADLAKYSAISEAQVTVVLNQLSSGEIRILRPIAPPPDQPDIPRFEIFHDVLGAAILDWRDRFIKHQEQQRLASTQIEAEQQIAQMQKRAQQLKLLLVGAGVLLLIVIAGIFIFNVASRLIFGGLGWLELLDLLLVIIPLYLLLRFSQGTQAAFLFRGVLILCALLFLSTIILPLPTFDWLLRGVLITILIVTPIIFLPEIRRLMERIGRSTGGTWEAWRSDVLQIVQRLATAVEDMSSRRTGALIVLEGQSPLPEIVASGVPIEGRITSALLQAVFSPQSPLHNGAAIIREDRVIAAGCILPGSRTAPTPDEQAAQHLEAALGLSEVNEALILVISEKNGEISLARQGDLQRNLDVVALRKHLYDFYTRTISAGPDFSLKNSIRKIRSRPLNFSWQSLMSNLGLFLISVVLALVAWTFVTEQTFPIERARIEAIPLQVEGLPAETTLTSPPPRTVSAIIETTAATLPTLTSRSFQATVSLAGLDPGLHRVPVQIISGISQVRVLSVEPSALDLEINPVVSRTFEVIVELTGQENLVPVYEVIGTPIVAPGQVQVIGPESLMRQVHQVQASLSLAKVTSSVREARPVRVLDEAGREITGLTIIPASVQVQVAIRRRMNVREVAVRMVMEGEPAPGYWISSLSVTPATVTLEGDPEQLSSIGVVIDTLPVDLSKAAGDITIQIPLDLPPAVQSLDTRGNVIRNVAAQAQISVRQGNLSLTRPVSLINLPSTISTTNVSPPEVRLLLEGPLPILDQIEADPNLIQVVVNAGSLSPGQSAFLKPTISGPGEVQGQLIPPSVLVIAP